MEAYIEYFSFMGLSLSIEIAIVLLCSVVFAVFGIILGCLIAGIDRKISAKMQGRIGPPLLQPLYDVRKLFLKEKVSVNGTERVYVNFALIFVFLAGGIFLSGPAYLIISQLFPELPCILNGADPSLFNEYSDQIDLWGLTTGGNFLCCVFILTLATLFFIMAVFSSRSPYSEIGGSREILQVLCYEPTVLLMAVGFYFINRSFSCQSVFLSDVPAIVYLWPTFICFFVILIIKFRKSPFDISTSHHAHQEIVRGTTTEMSGSTLGKVEIMHWCENVLFTLWISLFFLWNNPISLVIAAVVCFLVYFIIIWIDNNFARVKWQTMLKWSWMACLVCCGTNIVVLLFVV